MAPRKTRLLRFASQSLAHLPHNPAHVFAAGYALSIYPSDAVYSFIPKNGCSTMRYSLARANGAIARAEDFNWIHANNDTFRASLRELATAKYTFVILRDPYARLVSCYLDKIVDQTDMAWRYRVLRRYEVDAPDVTFRDFVVSLKRLLQADEHWRPQIDFLVYDRYDDYFALEDFSKAGEKLKKKIGFEVHDARALTMHGLDRFERVVGDGCFADKTARELLALKREGRVPDTRRMYDAALIDLVTSLYASDIAFYRENTGRDCLF